MDDRMGKKRNDTKLEFVQNSSDVSSTANEKKGDRNELNIVEDAAARDTFHRIKDANENLTAKLSYRHNFISPASDKSIVDNFYFVLLQLFSTYLFCKMIIFELSSLKNMKWHVKNMLNTSVALS